MDAVLGYVSKQAMNYALRSGFILTTSYVVNQGHKLIKSAPQSDARDELQTLQQRLSHKIRIISPAIDMIELIAARGNTSLESAITLTKELRQEIHVIGQQFAQTVVLTQKASSPKATKQIKADGELQMKVMCAELKKLLARIEDAVPLISLAITTSGVTLSTSLPQTVSPSRLLQASTLLVTGDSQYTANPHQAVQIGPTFTLSVYMLFAGHNRPQNEEEIRETTWKEVIHKARVKLRRVPLDLVTTTGSGSDATPSHHIKSSSLSPSKTDMPAEARADEFAYQLMVVEDLDDDRMHDIEEDQPQPGPFDDIELAGIREMIPVHELSKIFYADTSKVLNIGMDVEGNHPVLLLKRDLNAVPPRRMTERNVDDSYISNEDVAGDEGQDQVQKHVAEDHQDRHEDPWRLPPSLDPEWIALEVYTEDPDSETDELMSDNDESRLNPSPSLDQSLAKLNISSPSSSQSPATCNGALHTTPTHLKTSPSLPLSSHTAITTSLSLLEILLRLTSLQQFQQTSHLSITDELLNFFLEESASTGAGGDERRRQELRGEARRRVGWDVYDESPVKRRGESYQYRSPEAGWEEDGWRGTPGYESVRRGVDGRWSSPGPIPESASAGLPPSTSESAGGRGGGGVSRLRDLRSAQSPSPASPSPNINNRQRFLQDSRQDQNYDPTDEGIEEAMRENATQRARELEPPRQKRGTSPRRPRTGRSDEGLGTSPASTATPAPAFNTSEPASALVVNTPIAPPASTSSAAAAVSAPQAHPPSTTSHPPAVVPAPILSPASSAKPTRPSASTQPTPTSRTAKPRTPTAKPTSKSQRKHASPQVYHSGGGDRHAARRFADPSPGRY